MSKTDRFISEIKEADEVEIIEFNFSPCFAHMRKQDELIERLKSEAQMQAQEMRAMKSAVHDIYQGVGIQKGNWNGAKPVIDKFNEVKKDL